MDKERSGPSELLKPAPVETRLGDLKSGKSELKPAPVGSKFIEPKSGLAKSPVKTRLSGDLASGPVQPERKVKLTEVRREEGEKGLSINAETIKWFEGKVQDANTKFAEIEGDMESGVKKDGNPVYIKKGVELIDILIYLSGEIDKYTNELLSRIENLKSVRKENHGLRDLFDQLVEQHSRIQLLKSGLLDHKDIGPAYQEKNKIQELTEKNKEAIVEEFSEYAQEKLKETILSKFDDLKAWQQKDQEYQQLLKLLENGLRNSIKQLHITGDIDSSIFLENLDKTKPGLFNFKGLSKIKSRRKDFEQLVILKKESCDSQVRFINRYYNDIKALVDEFSRRFDEQSQHANEEAKNTLSEEGQKTFSDKWKSFEFNIKLDIANKMKNYLKDNLKGIYSGSYNQIDTPASKNMTPPARYDTDVADYIADDFSKKLAENNK